MDIIAAYREAGTYRGAAEIAGTTHKTVRRVIARHEAGGPRRRGRRWAVTMTAWPRWSRNAWRRRRAGSRRSDCCVVGTLLSTSMDANVSLRDLLGCDGSRVTGHHPALRLVPGKTRPCPGYALRAGLASSASAGNGDKLRGKDISNLAVISGKFNSHHYACAPQG
jgi:hypothetical protein